MSSLTRRDFVRSTGLSGAALMSPLLKNGFANSPNETIQVAVMGIRSRGTAHARNFACRGETCLLDRWTLCKPVHRA